MGTISVSCCHGFFFDRGCLTDNEVSNFVTNITKRGVFLDHPVSCCLPRANKDENVGITRHRSKRGEIFLRALLLDQLPSYLNSNYSAPPGGGGEGGLHDMTEKDDEKKIVKSWKYIVVLKLSPFLTRGRFTLTFSQLTELSPPPGHVLGRLRRRGRPRPGAPGGASPGA